MYCRSLRARATDFIKQYCPKRPFCRVKLRLVLKSCVTFSPTTHPLCQSQSGVDPRKHASVHRPASTAPSGCMKHRPLVRRDSEDVSAWRRLSLTAARRGVMLTCCRRLSRLFRSWGNIPCRLFLLTLSLSRHQLLPRWLNHADLPPYHLQR